MIYRNSFIKSGLVILFICSLFISCSGGSRGTGILTMRVTGRVQDSSGVSISDVALLVQTNAVEVEENTDSEGQFEAEILWSFGNPVNFTFGSNEVFPIEQIPQNTILMETVWELEQTGELVPVFVNFETE